MLDYKGIVAVISVTIYAIYLALLSYCTIRKCFATRAPWITLCLFVILRILGDSFQLALEDYNNRDNKHLVTGAAICNAVGLGPLLLVSTRLLLGCNAFIHTKPVPNQTHRSLITFELCTVISTVLTIVGGVHSFKPSHVSEGQLDYTTPLKVGVCLYAASFTCISGTAFLVASRRRTSAVAALEPHFGLATLLILATMPLLMVRILYSLLSIFDNDPKLSPLGNGNETIQLCLESVPEWLTTAIYVSIAILMRRAVPPKKEKAGKQELRGGLMKYLRFVPFVHWFIR